MRKFLILVLMLFLCVNVMAYPKLPSSQVSINTNGTTLTDTNLYDQLISFNNVIEKSLSLLSINTNEVTLTEIEFSPYNRTYTYVSEDQVYRDGSDYEIIPTTITPEGGSPTPSWLVRLYDMDVWRNGAICYATDFPEGPWRDQSESDLPIISGKGSFGYWLGRINDSESDRISRLYDNILSSKNANLGGNMITNISAIVGINYHALSFAPNGLQYNGEDAITTSLDDGKPVWLGYIDFSSVTNIQNINMASNDIVNVNQITMCPFTNIIYTDNFDTIGDWILDGTGFILEADNTLNMIRWNNAKAEINFGNTYPSANYNISFSVTKVANGNPWYLVIDSLNGSESNRIASLDMNPISSTVIINYNFDYSFDGLRFTITNTLGATHAIYSLDNLNIVTVESPNIDMGQGNITNVNNIGTPESPVNEIFISDGSIYIGTVKLSVTNDNLTISSTDTNIISTPVADQDWVTNYVQNVIISNNVETDPVAMNAGFITGSDVSTNETDPIAMNAGFITINDVTSENAGALSTNGGTMAQGATISFTDNGSVEGLDYISGWQKMISFESSEIIGDWNFTSQENVTNTIDFSAVNVNGLNFSGYLNQEDGDSRYVSVNPSNIVNYGREVNFHDGALYGGWNFRNNPGETNHYDFENVLITVPTATISNQPVTLNQLQSSLTNYISKGTDSQGGINKLVSLTSFTSTPTIVCTFSESIGELAQIEILNTTSTNFTYQIRTSGGITTNSWSINWIAVK